MPSLVGSDMCIRDSLVPVSVQSNRLEHHGEQRPEKRVVSVRYDPFLRPLFAMMLQAVGLYGYGYEKSYSRRALRHMLEKAGLVVVAETAILFIPGWLRMLDLACHAWCRPLAVVTGALVRPFVFLDRHVPAVRRHGYLLATVVTKPERAR